MIKKKDILSVNLVRDEGMVYSPKSMSEESLDRLLDELFGKEQDEKPVQPSESE